jgi:hypothetical protein
MRDGRQAGQIIPRGGSIWPVRVFMSLDSESGYIQAHLGSFEEDAKIRLFFFAHLWSL